MTSIQATTATKSTPETLAADPSAASKLFAEMQGKKTLTDAQTTNLIKGMSDLSVSNGDIDWLMGKVFKKDGSPATQNLFTQKLQERNTMAQTISTIWRTIFETMQAIARNMR